MTHRIPIAIRGLRGAGNLVHTVLTKHPKKVVGGISLGVGGTTIASKMHQGAQRTEHRLMQNLLNTNHTKYSSCSDLDLFITTKLNTHTKIASRQRNDYNFKEDLQHGMSQGAGKGIIAEGLGAIRRLLGFTAQKVNEAAVNQPKRRAILTNVLRNDPDIAQAEKLQPGQIVDAYNTMSRFAPELSTDPHAATSFLRNAAMTGGAMDYQTIKGLADAEAAVQKAQNEGAWLRRGF